MGWTYTNRPRGISNVDWFCSEWGDGRDGGEGVVDVGGKGFAGPLYVAYRTKKGTIHPAIALIRWVKDDYYNFGRKDFNADMGYLSCPKRILKLFNRDELRDFEQEWYDANMERWAERAKKTPVSSGDTVVLTSSIKLLNGDQIGAFVVENSPKFRWRYGFQGKWLRGRRWLLEEPYIAAIIKNGKGYSRAGGELPSKTVKELRAEDVVMLRNGWPAVIMNNENDGVRRWATVHGYFTEGGTVYAHDIVAQLNQLEEPWYIEATIKHTPAQERLRKELSVL